MTILVALILGIVEGLTEYLPVSSTGHLILVDHFLGGADDEARKSFEIVIQLGAILAVLVHYRDALVAARARAAVGQAGGDAPVRRARRRLSADGGRRPRGAQGDQGAPVRRAAGGLALVVGGVVMIAVELIRGRKPRRRREPASATSRRCSGFLIGIGQCASLIPGTSRSMATIVTGQLVGLSTATAAEFSFLLALPTLGAATICFRSGFVCSQTCSRTIKCSACSRA